MNNTPYNEGYINILNMHKLWYSEHGNAKGNPILWLHGGPGSGCSGNEHKYFDLAFYRVILLDQRGSGKSTPFCSLEDNTTQSLISDIEVLRKHLNIDKWSVLGASWGSLLALCYTIMHSDKVNGLILRGIYTGTDKEAYHLWYGMRDTFPEAWQELYEFLPVEERENLIESYTKRILNEDIEAIKAFTKYDTICAYHTVTSEALEQNLSDKIKMLGSTKIFIHYFNNNFFIYSSYIADNINKITHLPCVILHGRYDTICKPSVAYDLHKSLPHSTLRMIGNGGHTVRESSMENALKSAIEELKEQLTNSRNI